MEEIKKIIEGLSTLEIRSSFYYLGRYLKQADSFADYQKDIFVEDDRSAPSDLVKSITLELIEFIEMKADKNAADFTFEEYLAWIDIIDDIEINLDPLPDEDLVRKANSEIENFEKPDDEKSE